MLSNATRLALSATTARRQALIALAVLPAALLRACQNWEGGTGFTQDRFTYISRSWDPKTITLIDTRTGESMWSVDVPVGQQLVVGFYDGGGKPPLMPDLMYWALMPAGQKSGGSASDNKMPCPPADSRLLEYTRRPVPELPGAALVNRGPKEPTEVIQADTPAANSATPAPGTKTEHPGGGN